MESTEAASLPRWKRSKPGSKQTEITRHDD
jgi:hypothetical protein